MLPKFKSTHITSFNWADNYELLKSLCICASQDTRLPAENMIWEDWESTPASLMHTLAIQKRFDPPRGDFCITSCDGIPTAASGCYISDWSDRVMVIGTRTWTNPIFRDSWWHGEYFLPEQFRLAKDLGCAAVVLTFNEYNSLLKSFLQRIVQGKAVSLGSKNAAFYKDIYFYNDLYFIKNINQSIAVKLIACTKEDFDTHYLPPKASL